VDGTPAPNADRRFDAVGIFISTAPGACAGWISGTCTLIEPTKVLIARHSLDVSSIDPLPTLAAHPCRVRFRRAVDGTSENRLVPNGVICHGVYQEIDVIAITDAANTSSDEVIATLAHAPIGIHPIGVELNNPPSTAMNCILAGWGYSGQCYASGESWALRISRGVLPPNAANSDYIAFTYCLVGSSAPCLQCPVGPPRVNANLHDSGAPILIEVPSTDPIDPTPELRLVGTVSTLTYARRPSSWNRAGGQPALLQAAPAPHLRRADFNGNGRVDSEDLFAYFNAFMAGRLDADASVNGTIEIQDLFDFLNSWFAGV
jgi:hypothetical protein